MFKINKIKYLSESYLPLELWLIVEKCLRNLEFNQKKNKLEKKLNFIKPYSSLRINLKDNNLQGFITCFSRNSSNHLLIQMPKYNLDFFHVFNIIDYSWSFVKNNYPYNTNIYQHFNHNHYINFPLGNINYNKHCLLIDFKRLNLFSL